MNLKLPNNTEAEARLIGAICLDHSVMPDVIDVLNEDSFHDPLNQALFQAALACYNHEEPINPLTLTSALAGEQRDRATDRLAEVTANSSATDIGQVASFVRLVDQAARMRTLIRTAAEIVNQASAPGADADAVSANAASAMLKLATGGRNQRIADGPAVAKAAVTALNERLAAKDGVIGLTTSFPALDKMLGGLQGKKLYTVAGATSMGKSAIARDISGHVALDLEQPVYLVSLEMDLAEVAENIAASRARINLKNLTYELPEAIQEFYEVTTRLHNSDLHVDYSDRVSISQIVARARRLHARKPLGLILIDYLQLADGEASSRENRTQEVTNISRGLKGLARELDVPVIALSQLSRDVDKRTGDHTPRLSDLRESGAIEQDSDVVMFVYRPSYYAPNDHPRGKAEVIVGKQRGGPRGPVELQWFEQWASFRPVGWVPPKRRAA